MALQVEHRHSCAAFLAEERPAQARRASFEGLRHRCLKLKSDGAGLVRHALLGLTGVLPST